MRFFIILIAKVLVTTGYPKDAGIHLEVIALLIPNVICDMLPDFPIEIYVAVGGLINNSLLLICGGFNYLHTYE